MNITHIFGSSGAPSRKKIDAFVLAAGRGDLKDVKAFLDKYGNAFANSRYNEDGGSALRLALAQGRGDVAKELIARGADVNEGHTQGKDTLLMGCVRDNRPEMVRILLDAGADTRPVDFRGRNAFALAKRFHFNDVIQVFDPSFDATKAPDPEAVEEFVTAAGQGDLQKVKNYLGKYGKTYVDDMGAAAYTALSAAAHRGRIDVIRELHANGADLEIKDFAYSRTAVHLALECEQREAARELVRLGAAVDDDLLEIARRRKFEPEILREVEKRDNRSRRALDPSVPLLAPNESEVERFINGAGSGRLSDVLAFLDDFGPGHINDQGKYGSTAMSRAIFQGQNNIVKELEKRGVVIDTECLETAIRAGRWGLAKEFIDKAVAADEKCLMAALTNENTDCLKLVLDLMPHVDVKVYGNAATPLAVAAIVGKTDIVRELLDRGADLNAKTLAGDTPWQLAMDRGHTAVCQMLEAEAEYRERGKQPAAAPKSGPAAPV
ncbi:MAG: ankyrin repeat domain-containing protein [Alphaproteobacteria bacterium]